MSIDLKIGRKTTEEVVEEVVNVADELRMDCCTGMGAERTYYSYANHLRYNVEGGQKIHYRHIHLYIPNNGVMTVKVWDGTTKKQVTVLVKAKSEDLMSLYVLVNQFQRGNVGFGKRRNKGNKVCDYCKRFNLPDSCQIKGFLKEVDAVATGVKNETVAVV